MNKSAFIRFGIFVTAFRCLMAFIAIIKIVLAVYVKNRLISPIREWLSDVIFYSIFTPVFVLSVSIVDLMDYTKKNVCSFKKITSTEQNLKLKLYMMVTAVEAIILVCYCINLQYTLQTVSTEVKTILHAGLNKYGTNIAWRVFWNQFQQHYRCCGSSQNTDWFQTAWASPIIPSFSLVKKFIQENGKFIIPVAPIACCLPKTICHTFTDCEHPDPKKYYQNGCFSIIAESINSISSTRYLFYAVIIIQIISTVVKYEGYTDNSDNQKSKL